jgi:hypothetical protein
LGDSCVADMTSLDNFDKLNFTLEIGDFNVQQKCSFR